MGPGQPRVRRCCNGTHTYQAQQNSRAPAAAKLALQPGAPAAQLQLKCLLCQLSMLCVVQPPGVICMHSIVRPAGEVKQGKHKRGSQSGKHQRETSGTATTGRPPFACCAATAATAALTVLPPPQLVFPHAIDTQ